jgi:hypothetical protein
LFAVVIIINTVLVAVIILFVPTEPFPISCGAIGFVSTQNTTRIVHVIFIGHVNGVLGSAFILLATATLVSVFGFYLILFNVALDTLLTIRHIQPVAIVKELVRGLPGAAVPYAAASISHEHITIDKSRQIIGEWGHKK